MSKRFSARRVHGSFAEIAGGKPRVFHPCLDCGTKVYQHNAKRCNSCAHQLKKKTGLASYEKRKAKELVVYQQMLSILGIREHNGDCA